jgi:hypothetical protein
MGRGGWLFAFLVLVVLGALAGGYTFVATHPMAAHRLLDAMAPEPTIKAAESPKPRANRASDHATYAASVATLQAASYQRGTPTPEPQPAPTDTAENALVPMAGSRWPIDLQDTQTYIEVGVAPGFTWNDEDNATLQYLMLGAFESNDANSGSFDSEEGDFELEDSSGQVYTSTYPVSSQYNTPKMLDFTELPPGGNNQGTISFDIPRGGGAYSLLWQENFDSGWVPLAQVIVGPGHTPIVRAIS